MSAETYCYTSIVFFEIFEKSLCQIILLKTFLIKKQIKIYVQEVKIMYVDTHSHLYFDAYKKDREKIISEFDEEGLDFIVSIGIDVDSSKKSVILAKNHNKIYATAGIHPSEKCILKNGDIDAIKKLVVENDKVLAIGEIGLDYYRNYQSVEVQKKSFNLQLELAEELQVPVIIHDREAHNDIYNYLKFFKGKVRGIMHSFSGDYDFAKKMLDLGYYISITGVITFKKAETLRDVVKKVPLEYLLSETDCPFLTPEPYRGKRNQPAYVKYVVRKIAQVTGIDEDYVTETLVENAKKVFSIKS